MEWFIIEALVALAVAIAIVWWTMAPRRSCRATATSRRRAARARRRRAQCSVRGTDSVNSGIGASNAFPSAAIIW